MNEARFGAHRLVRPVLFGSILIAAGVMATFLVLSASGAKGTPAEIPAQIAFPPFEMVREVRIGERISTYRLVYRGPDDWKETLLTSSDPGVEVGRSQEVRDGRHVATVYGRESVSEPPSPAGPIVPGPWFGTLDWFVGRGRAAEKAGARTLVESRIGENVVRISTPEGWIWEHVFEARTGIPLEYTETVEGRVVVAHRVISLVLLDSGEVLR